MLIHQIIKIPLSFGNPILIFIVTNTFNFSNDNQNYHYNLLIKFQTRLNLTNTMGKGYVYYTAPRVMNVK